MFFVLGCVIPLQDGSGFSGPNWCFGLPFSIYGFRKGIGPSGFGSAFYFDYYSALVDLGLWITVASVVVLIFRNRNVLYSKKLEYLTCLLVFLGTFIASPKLLGTIDSILARNTIAGIVLSSFCLISLVFVFLLLIRTLRKDQLA